MSQLKRYNVPCTSVSIAADNALMMALYGLARQNSMRIGDLVRSAVENTLRADLAPLLPPDYFGEDGAQKHHTVQTNE